MKKSTQVKLSRIAERLAELSTLNEKINNPAYIHFMELSRELSDAIIAPETADQGEVINISVLQRQLEEVAHKYKGAITELKVNLIDGAKTKTTLSFYVKRLFPSDEQYEKNSKSFWSIDPDKAVQELDAWYAEHAKEAEGHVKQDPQVVLEKKEVGS